HLARRFRLAPFVARASTGALNDAASPSRYSSTRAECLVPPRSVTANHLSSSARPSRRYLSQCTGQLGTAHLRTLVGDEGIVGEVVLPDATFRQVLADSAHEP